MHSGTFSFKKSDLAHVLTASHLDTIRHFGEAAFEEYSETLVSQIAARLLTCIEKRHIILSSQQLHWLLVCFQVQFKVLVMTDKALDSTRPGNLKELISSYDPPQILKYQTRRQGRDSSSTAFEWPAAGGGRKGISVFLPGLEDHATGREGATSVDKSVNEPMGSGGREQTAAVLLHRQLMNSNFSDTNLL